MTDIQSPPTDDEATVLQIAAQGMTIGAIGRWAGAVESLLTRGLLKDMSGDKFNCVITDAGRAAMDGLFLEEVALANAAIVEQVDHASKALMRIAKISARSKGDDVTSAAKKWANVILTRALELLR